MSQSRWSNTMPKVSMIMKITQCNYLTKITVNIVLFVAITIAISNVEGSCPSEEPQGIYFSPLWNNWGYLFKIFNWLEKLYGCRAIDEEGQQVHCTCIELEENGNFNCTNCFAQYSRDGQYRDCFDALRKGLNDSGVYSLKPDNMEPFKVQHCF